MTLEREIESVRKARVFGAMPPNLHKLLCFASDRLTFEPAEVLFREGDPAAAAFVLVSGAVSLSVETCHGTMLIETLSEPEVLGEAGLLGGIPHPFTASARSRSEVLRVPGELYRRIACACPETVLDLNRLLAARMTAAMARMGRPEPRPPRSSMHGFGERA